MQTQPEPDDVYTLATLWAVSDNNRPWIEAETTELLSHEDDGVALGAASFFRLCPDADDQGRIERLLRHNLLPATHQAVRHELLRVLGLRFCAGRHTVLPLLRGALLRKGDAVVVFPFLALADTEWVIESRESFAGPDALHALLGFLEERVTAEALAPPEPEPSPIDEHRRLIGSLLDHDASEVFDIVLVPLGVTLAGQMSGLTEIQ